MHLDAFVAHSHECLKSRHMRMHVDGWSEAEAELEKLKSRMNGLRCQLSHAYTLSEAAEWFGEYHRIRSVLDLLALQMKLVETWNSSQPSRLWYKGTPPNIFHGWSDLRLCKPSQHSKWQD